jgi:hypothetical protein
MWYGRYQLSDVLEAYHDIERKNSQYVMDGWQYWRFDSTTKDAE